jgi:hypothetical protein
MARDIFRRRWYPPLKKRYQPLVTLNANVDLVGVAATSAIGSFAIEDSPSLDLVGVAATSAIGSFAIDDTSSVDLTGVSATADVGTFGIIAGTVVPLSGVEATTDSGSFTFEVSPSFDLTGDAATSAVGHFAFDITSSVHLTGVSATAQVGIPEVNPLKTVALHGVAATSAVGHLAPTETSSIDLTGVAATSAYGSFVPNVIKLGHAGQQAVSAVGIFTIESALQNIPLVGVAAHAQFSGFPRTTHLTGVSATAQFGVFSEAGLPGPRTFFIGSTIQSIIAPGVQTYPTSDTIDKGSTNYIIGSSQFYTVGQVSWGDVVRVEGTDWRLVSPFGHIIELLDPPSNGTPITLLYVKWNIQAIQGFTVTSYPVPFSFINTTIVAEALPPTGQFFHVNFIGNRIANNPQTLFSIFPTMVDDMLDDYLLYDSPLGFQTYRPDCYTVVDTSTWNVYQWTGAEWSMISVISNGTSFYVKSTRQVWENVSGTATLKYTAGDGADGSYPEVLVYPPFGEGVGKNLLADGFSADAPTDFPAAYQICQSPGPYDSVCVEEGGFDEEFDFDFDG